MNRADQAGALRAQRCILVTHRDDVGLKVQAAQGSIDLLPEIDNPILDLMADGRPHSLGELEKELSGNGREVVLVALSR